VAGSARVAALKYFEDVRKYITYRNAVRKGSSQPRTSVTCTKKLVKIGRAVLEICSRTDRQTDRHGHHNTPLVGAE